MQNCYSNRYICMIIVALYMIFFLSPLPCLVKFFLTLSSQPQHRPTSQPTTINHHQHPPTTTANPLQYQFNPNTINPKLMINHHKPNIKSTQNKTPKNLFGKIQINLKPKPLLPWNASHHRERESVSVLSHGGLVERIFFFFFQI